MALIHEELTNTILGAAVEVHRLLGPGLLESVYARCLVHELELRGIAVRVEAPFDVEYKGVVLPSGYRVDLLVADAVVVEVKAVDKVHPIHRAQLLTYLRLSGTRVGLLLNFNVEMLVRDGMTRVVV